MSNPETPNPNKIAGYQNLINIFDGELFHNIEYFLQNLEDVANIAQWNDAEKIAVFKSKLKGVALQFFIEDPELMSETDYSKFKAKFSKFFEKQSSLSLRQQKFSTCKQDPGESVRSFSAKVSNLTIQYFGIQNSSKADAAPIIDQTKLAKFLEGLQPSLKRLVLNRNPATFNEAVEYALSDEINAQFTQEGAFLNNSTTNQRYPVEEKLEKILDRQNAISEQLIDTLTEQVNKLSTRQPYRDSYRGRRGVIDRPTRPYQGAYRNPGFSNYAPPRSFPLNYPHQTHRYSTGSYQNRRGFSNTRFINRPTNFPNTGHRTYFNYQSRLFTPRTDNEWNTVPNQTERLNSHRGR